MSKMVRACSRFTRAALEPVVESSTARAASARLGASLAATPLLMTFRLSSGSMCNNKLPPLGQREHETVSFLNCAHNMSANSAFDPKIPLLKKSCL